MRWGWQEVRGEHHGTGTNKYYLHRVGDGWFIQAFGESVGVASSLAEAKKAARLHYRLRLLCPDVP